MQKNSNEAADLRSYDAPRIVEVGTVAEFTSGYTEPVADPPVGQDLGYYNAAKNLTGADVDLDAA
ncbi:MAG TPA: hypothetical protein VF535_14235 [Allosphingosinicella sp.]|jgi:hypothetical protein